MAASPKGKRLNDGTDLSADGTATASVAKRAKGIGGETVVFIADATGGEAVIVVADATGVDVALAKAAKAAVAESWFDEKFDKHQTRDTAKETTAALPRSIRMQLEEQRYWPGPPPSPEDWEAADIGEEMVTRFQKETSGFQDDDAKLMGAWKRISDETIAGLKAKCTKADSRPYWHMRGLCGMEWDLLIEVKASLVPNESRMLRFVGYISPFDFEGVDRIKTFGYWVAHLPAPPKPNSSS